MNIFIDRFTKNSNVVEALNTIAECLGELTYTINRIEAKLKKEHTDDE